MSQQPGRNALVFDYDVLSGHNSSACTACFCNNIFGLRFLEEQFNMFKITNIVWMNFFPYTVKPFTKKDNICLDIVLK